MNPKVSVIIPNYNHSRFLNQRIESVLKQTFSDFEVIILDDCSSDNSSDIIEAYRGNSKVSQIIYSDTNSGTTFKQWQKGVNIAKGEYIWLAESDDFADETFLEKLLLLINDNPNIGLAYCNSHVINEHNQVWDNTNNWCGMVHDKGCILENTAIINGRQFCLDYLVYVNLMPNASAVLFRRELVVENLKCIDSSFRNSGDWKLWIYILLNSDLAYLNENLNFFRKHSTNVTGSIFLIKQEALRILKEVLKTKFLEEKYVRNIYRSLFIWSFNPAFWINKFSMNHSNIRFYFSDNISLRSIKYFFYYYYKKNWL